MCQILLVVQLFSRTVLLSFQSFWRSALLTPLVYHRLFHPVVRSCRSASKHIQCMCLQSLFISPREMVVFVCSAFGHASWTARVSFSPNTNVCPPFICLPLAMTKGCLLPMDIISVACWKGRMTWWSCVRSLSPDYCIASAGLWTFLSSLNCLGVGVGADLWFLRCPSWKALTLISESTVSFYQYPIYLSM